LAGAYNTSTDDNVYIGHLAGMNSTSSKNTFVGSSSGENTTTGGSNSFFGANSGKNNGSGSYNSIFGQFISSNNSDGYGNTIMGCNAGDGLTGASYNYNCLFGYNAGNRLETGNNNVMMGYRSGYANDTGTNNVFIGYEAGESNQSGSYNVFIGNQVGGVAYGASNRLLIDNQETSFPLIYGEFDNDLLRVNGDLEVTGNSAVTGTSTVGGTQTVTGDATFNGRVGIGLTPNSSYLLDVQGGRMAVRGWASTSTESYTYGIYGYATGASTSNWAGYFNGNINVTGSVVKSVSKTKIDHPLDPKNKFLTHATVESDQMMNIYNGVVFLNSDGKTVVTMPNWFESLNTEFRYQLTAIGAPGPNLYISKKISGNTFEISGGVANMEVSWQVTGVRQDNFAKANPIEVEKTKDSMERGYYLHPEAYGLSEKDGIEYQHLQEMNKIERLK
ncbi:MAG: hypothetical protein GQ534_02440, partial [Candidatus Delongbacteria bacterium]|nr:hypothetical protein [Candidatus Delongbacteria bacterium]